MPRKKVDKAAAAVQDAISTDDMLERFKDFEAIDVISRRFNDPDDPGSLPILLGDESPDACVNSDHQNRMKENTKNCHLCGRPNRRWYVRFINSSQEGRFAQIKAKGYLPVPVAKLRDEHDISDLVKGTLDGWARRGDRGQEILVYMPLEAYNRIKKAQKSKRMERFTSRKHMQTDMASHAGSELGSEMGEAVARGGIQFESFQRTKSSLAEETGNE